MDPLDFIVSTELSQESLCHSTLSWKLCKYKKAPYPLIRRFSFGRLDNTDLDLINTDLDLIKCSQAYQDVQNRFWIGDSWLNLGCREWNLDQDLGGDSLIGRIFCIQAYYVPSAGISPLCFNQIETNHVCPTREWNAKRHWHAFCNLYLLIL